MHVQIIHRVVMFSSVDPPDDREYCFLMVDCGWDTCRLCGPFYPCSFWTSLAVWFTGYIGFPVAVLKATGLLVTASSWRLQVSDSEKRSTSPDSSFVATSFPVAVSINPRRYASCSRTWELDAASDFEFLLMLLSGFPLALSIPGLLDPIRRVADEELVGTWEGQFVAVDFDFATMISSPFCSCILFAIILVQLIKLEFLPQQVDMKFRMFNKWRRLSHSSRVNLP